VSEAELLVVAAAEAPGEVAVCVSAPIVEDRTGRLFVVRDVRAAHAEGLPITRDEFDEGIARARFVRTTRWPYRPMHTLAFVRNVLLDTLRRQGLTLAPAEFSRRSDGWTASYIALDALTEFREDAVKPLRELAIQRMRDATARGLVDAEIDELHRWIEWTLALSARGSVQEVDAAVLWLAAQERFRPDRAQAARDTALWIRGMTEASLER